MFELCIAVLSMVLMPVIAICLMAVMLPFMLPVYGLCGYFWIKGLLNCKKIEKNTLETAEARLSEPSNSFYIMVDELSLL